MLIMAFIMIPSVRIYLWQNLGNSLFKTNDNREILVFTTDLVNWFQFPAQEIPADPKWCLNVSQIAWEKNCLERKIIFSLVQKNKFPSMRQYKLKAYNLMMRQAGLSRGGHPRQVCLSHHQIVILIFFWFSICQTQTKMKTNTETAKLSSRASWSS